jgi:hypothetical protein
MDLDVVLQAGVAAMGGPVKPVGPAHCSSRRGRVAPAPASAPAARSSASGVVRGVIAKG